MNMLEMLEQEVSSLGFFETDKIPEIVTAIADSIPSDTIPYRMKIALAMSEITLFISQFRINIKHWNESIIPINAITFCIAKSGASKDSSLRAARRCFETGYSLIHEIRKEECVHKAIEEARSAGYEIPDSYASYKAFLKNPSPLFASVSTVEGLIQHFNDLSKEPLGAGYIISSELGAELASNTSIVENIRITSELYDMGNKEVKLLKNRDSQSEEIKSFPVSALFLGSKDNIIFDEGVKKKFKTEFTTKLARRSYVIFVDENITSVSYQSIKDMLDKEREREDLALKNMLDVQSYITDLTNSLLDYPKDYIICTPEVRDAFNLYRKYNECVAEGIDATLPMSKLTRQHLQWKALKLAGALALINGCDKIELPEYIAAVQYGESVNDDLNRFEKELMKEPYELFVDYAHSYAKEGNTVINLHTLKKGGFISSRNIDASLSDLAKMANAYDDSGTYALKDDTITFNALNMTDDIVITWLECSGTKKERAVKCTTGYVSEVATFDSIEELLKGDYAYTPFRLKNGVRGKDNVMGGCKWLVLDVDDTDINDSEAHILLSDYNHYIVRTSNEDNDQKYRVILELDAELNITDQQWKPFIQAVSSDLGIHADLLPKSQIFFSYAGRTLHKALDGIRLPIKPYLAQMVIPKQKTQQKLNMSQKMAYLDDPMTTFQPAFEAPMGCGRQKIIWALKYARELGAVRAYCHDLLDKINEYWVKPLPENDKAAIHRQIDRWDFPY